MEAVRRWQRQIALATAALLCVWLLGLIILNLAPDPNKPLSLHVIATHKFKVAEPVVMSDGRDGICVQDADGRLLHFGDNGRLVWSIDTFRQFRLQLVQPADGYLVLAGSNGCAYAINDDGSERWCFEPVHHEMQIELRKRRVGQASFYTMATALVYGLDERGVLQWVRLIPSASSMATQRPWMQLDPEGYLLTRANSGRIRVSPQGESLLIRHSRSWLTDYIDIDDSGRVLEDYGYVQISAADGLDLHDDLGVPRGRTDSEQRSSWLTEEGFAQVSGGRYMRFDNEGKELRSTVSDWQLLASAPLAGDQLLLWAGPGEFLRLQVFPMMLQLLFRGHELNYDNVSTTDNARGRSRLDFESAELSVGVRLPGWLQRSDCRVFEYSADKLLFIDEQGLGRICRLGGSG